MEIDGVRGLGHETLTQIKCRKFLIRIIQFNKSPAPSMFSLVNFRLSYLSPFKEWSKKVGGSRRGFSVRNGQGRDCGEEKLN